MKSRGKIYEYGHRAVAITAKLYNFDIGKFDIKVEHYNWLISVVAPKLRSGGSLTIIGLASRTGTDAFNMNLSENRSRAVIDLLRKHVPNNFKVVVEVAMGERAALYAGVRDGVEQENWRCVIISAWDKAAPPPPPPPPAPKPAPPPVAAAASGGHPLVSVRIWLKAFIPQYTLRVPGYDCFLGDNRSFSSNRSAPARTHSEVLLYDLNTAPKMNEIHRCGLTSQVDCDTGQVIGTKTAPTHLMRFYNFRYPGAEVYNWDQPYPPAANPGTIIVPPTARVSVDYEGKAADPIPPIAPMIDFYAHIEIDLSTGELTVTGEADEYPAFEGYVLVNGRHGR